MISFTRHHYKELDSTNIQAAKMIEQGLAREPILVTTDVQTQGRGHAQSSWESEGGMNITLSFVVRPHFMEPQQQFLLTQIISLSVVELVKQLIPEADVSIKWPNDIYIGVEKLGGILIQNTIKGHSIDYSIIGLGLNINQKQFHSDAPNPTSLCFHTNEKISIKKLLDLLQKQFAHHYESSRSPAMQQQMHEEYIKHLFRYQEQAKYQVGDTTFVATISNVDTMGQLHLMIQDGTIRKFGFKEVSFLI